MRNHVGDLVGVGVKQGREFSSSELEEANACLFAIKYAWGAGVHKLIIEGDYLSLILKLKQRQNPRSAPRDNHSKHHLIYLTIRFYFLKSHSLSRE